MTMGRWLSLVAVPLLFLVSLTTSQASDVQTWNGTWSGLLNKNAPISVTIANGKVTSYTIEGAPFNIRYSKLTPTTVSFGDRDHYAVTLTKTGDTTASEIAHGRNGFGSGSLTKQ
jgi:hypothetical protein